MAHKQRGYKRETPKELVRDSKLFAIACEGSEREPKYFKVFEYLSTKIKVDVIEHKVEEVNDTKSAPKWVLDRAVDYINKENLNDKDDLWFVIDKDRWTDEQLRELETYCAKYPNWHLVISNPCFEVWLYFHKKKNILDSTSKSAKDFKNEISKLENGGYHPFKFIPHLNEAITNAKESDSDKSHFLPKFKETKVYQLAEAIIRQVGKNDFDDFVNTAIPRLIQEEKRSVSKKKKTRKN